MPLALENRKARANSSVVTEMLSPVEDVIKWTSSCLHLLFSPEKANNVAMPGRKKKRRAITGRRRRLESVIG